MKYTTIFALFLCVFTTNVVAAYSSDVYSAQKILNQLGFNTGVADGLMGKKTKNAIIEYQKSRNLAITGKINLSLMGKLSSEIKQMLNTTNVKKSDFEKILDQKISKQVQKERKRLAAAPCANSCLYQLENSPIISTEVEIKTSVCLLKCSNKEHYMSSCKISIEYYNHEGTSGMRYYNIKRNRRSNIGKCISGAYKYINKNTPYKYTREYLNKIEDKEHLEEMQRLQERANRRAKGAAW